MTDHPDDLTALIALVDDYEAMLGDGITDANEPPLLRNARAALSRLAAERRGGEAETERQAVHEWFELSYAQYLTVPRSVLQSMPDEWQGRFARCLRELDEYFSWRPTNGRYWVQLKDDHGRYVADPLMDYERGRRRLTQTDVSATRRRQPTEEPG